MTGVLCANSYPNDGNLIGVIWNNTREISNIVKQSMENNNINILGVLFKNISTEEE